MKNILFVSYLFPPMAGPGVHRSLNFVINLRKHDYNPIVLKADEKKLTFEKTYTDPTLVDDLPKDLQIIKTHPFNLDKTKQLLIKLKVYRFFWFLLYPLFWNRGAIWPFLIYKRAKQIVLKNNIKTVYTTSGPFSTWILGYLLKKNLHIKWIADNRDPYVDSYSSMFPSKFHWYISCYFEKWILSKSDHIIVNTPAVRRLYISRNYAKPEKITVITNGF